LILAKMLNYVNGVILCLWLIAIVLSVVTRSLLPLLLPWAVVVVHEIFYAYTGISLLFPSGRITENFYDLSMIPTKYVEVDHNYSEGWYPDGDLSITPTQAENYKFDEILRLLGAQPGDRILDMGCGTCTFETYCKTLGIEMVGLTLSSEQVDLCKSKGVKSIRGDYTKFQPDLVRQFDHIIMMGSSEHISGGPHHHVASFVRKEKKLAKVMSYCKQYMGRDPSRPGKLFYSGLHINPLFIHKAPAYFLDRTYGGTLQLDSPSLDSAASLTEAGFKIEYRRDSTYEYYLATELNPNHFGNPAPLTAPLMFALAAMSIYNPLCWYMYFYYALGYWMWMFDGHVHTASNPNLTFQEDRMKRPCTLWWVVAS
jgi:SAM-dependent methyltransferase